jgi:hypothetical protein
MSMIMRAGFNEGVGGFSSFFSLLFFPLISIFFFIGALRVSFQLGEVERLERIGATD